MERNKNLIFFNLCVELWLICAFYCGKPKLIRFSMFCNYSSFFSTINLSYRQYNISSNFFCLKCVPEY
jgi:hypothetical protein